ncbi:MAG TPA: DUF4249 domain-containing protein [Bacteroidales bacterium]|nr:DUF4249 domain-containing protein [Bacteroidales bacterium]
MKRYTGIMMVAITLIFSSCTERIHDINLDSTFTHLVVYGEITTESKTQWVRLSTTANYFSNVALPVVSGAVIHVYDGTDSVKMVENDSIKGLYQTYSGYRGVPGKTYKLFINNVDVNNDGNRESYTAESFLPPENPVDSITLQYTSNLFGSGWNVNVWALDDADMKNYYAFKSYKNGVLLTDTLTEYIVQNDDLFNGSYTNGITAQYLSDSNGTEKAVPGDTITFELDGITAEYYRFIQEAQSESFGNNPIFSGPPANIVGNISNGALGFFTAYSISRASKVVPDYSSAN